jgi:glycosyltransferase involved in cell wall biosynthesis
MSDHASPGAVLHVVPFDLARGAQRYARTLVDALVERGEAHQVLTLFDSDSNDLNADMTLGVPRGVLRRAGLDPRAVLRLRKAVRRLAPPLVVAHGGESAKYAALALPRPLPFVYLRIGTGHESLQKWGKHLLNDYFVRRAAKVVAVSRDVADEVARLHRIPAERLMVIPNARDPETFQPRFEARAPDRPKVVFVGHLNDGKRPDRFIEVVAALRARGRMFEAVLVGDGPLMDTLKPLAAAAGVTMLGRRDDVAEIMSGADIFVFPSLAPGEGMPGVLIEAGLSGLATVSTRVPGARDVVDDGVTGFLVDIEDGEGMISAVDRLVTGDKLRRDMGERARAHCARQFTLEATVDAWKELFRSYTAREEHQSSDVA